MSSTWWHELDADRRREFKAIAVFLGAIIVIALANGWGRIGTDSTASPAASSSSSDSAPASSSNVSKGDYSGNLDSRYLSAVRRNDTTGVLNNLEDGVVVSVGHQACAEMQRYGWTALGEATSMYQRSSLPAQGAELLVYYANQTYCPGLDPQHSLGEHNS
jgi:hypothetical protein